MSECERPTRCHHNRVGHCCRCLDCERFEREPDWCVRCGLQQVGIGWDNTCSDCDAEMAAELGPTTVPTGEAL